MNKIIKNTTLMSLMAFALLGLGGCAQQVTVAEAKEKYQSTPPGTYFSEVFRFSSESTTQSGDDSSHAIVHVNTAGGNRYSYTLLETTLAGTTTTVETLAYQTSDTLGNIYIKTNGELVSTIDSPMAAINVIVDASISGIREVMCADYSDVFDVAESADEATCYIQGNGTISLTYTIEGDSSTIATEMVFSPQSMLTKSRVDTTFSDGSTAFAESNYTMSAAFSEKTSL